MVFHCLHCLLWRCWLGGGGLWKTDWWDAGVVICLGRDADLHTSSWCHCHSLSLAPVNPDWFYFPGFTFLVPANPGSPGHSPGGRKKVVVVVVVVVVTAAKIIKWKPNVTNHLSSQFSSFLAEVQNILFKEHGDWLHLRQSLCLLTNLRYCYWQLCTHLINSLSEFLNSRVFPEFSRINKFPEISRFSRVVSTLAWPAMDYISSDYGVGGQLKPFPF